MIQILFEGSSVVMSLPVARPMPDAPPVMTTTLFLRFVSSAGATVNTFCDILLCGCRLPGGSFGVGVYQ